MSNPTSNFGWQMPTATDLVTDLPADFEVFGQAVDTALMDLKGGTTGQVLKKNTNADMDFVWSADAAGMTNPMTTTGDTIYSSSGSTPARLGIGTTGQVLTVAGGVPTWAATGVAVNNYTLIGSTALSGSSTVTVSGISNKNFLLIYLNGASPVTPGSDFRIRFNADASNNYKPIGQRITSGGAVSFQNPALVSFVELGTTDTGSHTSTWTGIINMQGSAGTGYKPFQYNNYGQGGAVIQTGLGFYIGGSAISSVSAISTVGNFDAGTIEVYGA